MHCPEGYIDQNGECVEPVRLGIQYDVPWWAGIVNALSRFFDLLLLPFELVGKGTAKIAGAVAGSFWDTLSARGKAVVIILILAVLLVYFGPLIGRAQKAIAK